ncbi:HAD hydrolase family protein [Nordella sp. HKS 07]|uniref:HAD hydrolase family protein n=1 Tax=Nordella sp. HKS 07 TaxID=2712222 RepID=UPI0013E0F9E5|nr:HAD hydrolase family protein [Nordella sp. HKS 07]QIG50402.1 HAD hydrolase family protein [Nordella sp. HKS 07]
MYLISVATDYDGTLAHNGRVDPPTIAAFERLKASGRKLLMVTGRELPHLKRVFARLDLFDGVVAENGSLLYFPEREEERLVAAKPPAELVAALRNRGVHPLSVGGGIIATWEPNETTVLECIRELGLEWQIIFNKGAVMVLPPGVNKATGLAAALNVLEISPLNVLGIGDAENDHAFLTASGCSAAVSNAIDSVKEVVDVVTSGDHGAGVIEIIDALLSDEQVFTSLAAKRHKISLGKDEAAVLQPEHGAVLIAGASGIGKSTLATAIIEKLIGRGFEICVFDPEGDYDDLEKAIVLGDAQRAPVIDEVLDILRKPVDMALVVNMLGLPLEERPKFFAELLSRIQQMRSKIARPHWLVVDEAHHMLPAESEVSDVSLPDPLSAVIYVTVHPEAMRPKALAAVQIVIGVGPKANQVVLSFCAATGTATPTLPSSGKDEEVLFWDRTSGEPPRWIGVDRPQQEHQRHTRKYAQGDLGEDNSFYFRGPRGKLNLRAQNLMIFLQIADGVDDKTWLHHLHRGDYSRWFRESIKDEKLADEVEKVQDDADPVTTRKDVRAIVERRYTAPSQTS